jgi:hypothetical protein
MKSYFLNIFVLNFLIFINFTGFLFANPIQPGPLSYEEIQKAMILSKPGDVIELGEGIFEFEDGLSLDIDNVTILGEGINKTILSFKNQKSGAEGLMITSNGVILKDFAVEDTIGDAIVVKDGRFGPYITDGKVNVSLKGNLKEFRKVCKSMSNCFSSPLVVKSFYDAMSERMTNEIILYAGINYE